MITKVSNNENAESGLLPYPVIIAATKGDPEAMAIVVKHYESYITSLSMRKLYDERGNVYWGIDEDIRDRLRSRQPVEKRPAWEKSRQAAKHRRYVQAENSRKERRDCRLAFHLASFLRFMAANLSLTHLETWARPL